MKTRKVYQAKALKFYKGVKHYKKLRQHLFFVYEFVGKTNDLEMYCC